MSYQGKSLGQSGEDLAAEFLEQKSYKILQRNLRLRVGEIDILAQDGEYVVVVEVKTKRYIRQGRPEEMVNWWKQKKLRLLARAISQLYLEKPIRIDVVAIDETLYPARINHIINAVIG